MTAEITALLLLLLMALLRLVTVVLTKKFQQSIPVDAPHLAMYSMVSSAFACIGFALISGFHIEINLPTLIYSLIYAILIIVSSATKFISLHFSSVSLTTITEMSGRILPPTLFGVWYFLEPADWKLVVSAILILLAIILPQTKNGIHGTGLISVVNCVFLFLSTGGTDILTKLYAKSDEVCSSESLFFLSNAIIIIICLLYGVFLAATKGLSCLKAMVPSAGQAGIIAANTFIFNIISIISITVLATMHLSTYTMINSSLTLIGAFFVSLLIFREKQNRESVIATLCAIAAVIVTQL